MYIVIERRSCGEIKATGYTDLDTAIDKAKKIAILHYSNAHPALNAKAQVSRKETVAEPGLTYLNEGAYYKFVGEKGFRVAVLKPHAQLGATDKKDIVQAFLATSHRGKIALFCEREDAESFSRGLEKEIAAPIREVTAARLSWYWFIVPDENAMAGEEGFVLDAEGALELAQRSREFHSRDRDYYVRSAKSKLTEEEIRALGL